MGGRMIVSGGTGRIAALGLVAALATTVIPVGAGADDYAGKRITFTVGFGAGGGYDLFARFAADHLGRHIPGNPTVVVQNVPGAGGMRLANQLYNVHAGSAVHLGMVSQVVATEQVIGNPGIEYDANRFNWIGRIAPNVAVSFTWHTSPVKTIEDAIATEAIMGGTGPGAASVVAPTMMNATLGTKFKIVRGYGSMGEAMLAMEQGEVDGALLGWSVLKSSKPDWLTGNRLNILVQHALSRHPELPNVPTTPELAKNEQDRQLLEFVFSSADLGFSVFMPPGVDAAHVRTLRQAFDAMANDPKTLEDARKRNVEFNPVSGEKIQALVRNTADVPPDVLARARKIYGR